MLVTGKLLKPLKEARYLNVENTDRYRPVLRLFYMNYEIMMNGNVKIRRACT